MFIVTRCPPGAAQVMRLFFGLALWVSTSVSSANTIVVNDASSGSVAGKCTIQDAVAAANTNAAVNGCAAGAAGADTITFASGITMITLTAPMAASASLCVYGLAVAEDLTIDAAPVAGSGVPVVTIQRSSAAGTPNFGIIGASLYNCGASPAKRVNLTLAGVALGNGNSTGSGGGVAADILTVRDSAITGNSAASGGGIYAFYSLTMTSSTVSNNSASSNYGGGIAGDVPITIGGSTISGNTGSGITGLSSTITIDNSTVSGNTNSGIDTGSIAAYFVTITANTGAGVYLELGVVNNSVAEFDDTLIAGNGVPPSVHDLETSASRPITGTYNYFGTVSAVGLNDLGSGVRIPVCANLNLGPLANNCGGTQTHALLAGSCLIDAGGTVSPGGLSFAHDQRGGSFPRFVNTRADIGAFEYQGVPAAVNGACGSDNGQTLLAAPVNLCSAGSASAVGGSGHPWSWTCAGTGGGSNASCTATIRTWTVTAAVAGSGGTVSPPTQTVDNGATASVTAAPAPGYALASASGCGGALSGNDYTTAAVTANCSISVAFTAAPVAAVALSSSANPAVSGQSVTLTATVSGNGATPTGVVTFFDGASSLGRVATAVPAHTGASPDAMLNASGIATLTAASLSVGTHAIRASYAGDGTYAAATSNTLNQVVNPAPASAPVGAPALSAWALYFLAACTAISAFAAGRRRRRSDG